MNAKSLKDYLAAASACDPEASFSGPQELAAAVAETDPAVEWRIGLCGADASLLLLAPDTADGLEAVWSTKSSRWLRCDVARRDRLQAATRRFSARVRPARRLDAARFSAGLFEEPVASALASFHALAPVGKVLFASRRREWALVLAAPLAWSLFLRCDVAAAFAPRAAQLSLLLRGARVEILGFDGDALWVRLAG